jgi:hypothetical protein
MFFFFMIVPLWLLFFPLAIFRMQLPAHGRQARLLPPGAERNRNVFLPDACDLHRLARLMPAAGCRLTTPRGLD